MASDLVRRQVTVIAATSTPAALAAKAATSTIPIVFETGGDPIKLGLVTSLNRPGGNVTGAASLAVEVMAAKGLELLHELIPAGRVVGLLVNPNDPAAAEPQEREVLRAARTLGLEVHVLNAGAEREFDGRLCEARRIASVRADDQCGCVLHEPYRTTRDTGGAPRDTRCLCTAWVRHSWRTGNLWIGHYGIISPSRNLYWASSQGRQTR
jgi:hypothetical protein